MDMETEGTNLPWELIIEIFSRLPVKSLMRLRSVSRPCCSLVTEPHFINKHLYQSTQNSLKRVILSPSLVFHKHLVSCPLSSLSHKPIEDAAKLIYPMKDKSRYVRLWDSCDGLFCIEITGDDEKRLLLWNPSTRQSKTLSYTPIETPSRFDEENLTFSYAFGFDSLNNDYKVLRLAKFDNSRQTKIEADIYSLNNNSWRKINESPQYKWSDPFLYPRLAVHAWTDLPYCYKCVNGAIHWLSIEKNAVKSTKIFSLNLSTERFGEVPQPNCAIMQNLHEWVEVSLSVLRGMLCVYCNCDEHSFVLWVMKDYGHQESWEKIFDIPFGIFDRPSTDSKLYYFFVPMYLHENGEILLGADSSKGISLVTYSKNRYGFKKVVARGLNRIKEGRVYVESLISPLAQTHL